MSMQQSSTDFVGDLLEYASEEFKRYLVATSPLTVFPSLFVSGHNAFELFQTAQMRAMELVELANTNPQLRAVLLAERCPTAVCKWCRPLGRPLLRWSMLTAVRKPCRSPRPTTTSAKPHQRAAAGSPPKKGDKAKKAPRSPPRPTSPTASWETRQLEAYLHGPDARQARAGLLQPRPQNCGWQRDCALGNDGSVRLHHKNGRSHRLRSDTECSLLGLRHVDAPHSGLRALSLQSSARPQPRWSECADASETVDVQRRHGRWGFSVAVSSGVDPRHGALAPHPTHGATSSSVAPRRVATRRSHARHSPSVACTQTHHRRVETLKPDRGGWKHLNLGTEAVMNSSLCAT